MRIVLKYERMNTNVWFSMRIGKKGQVVVYSTLLIAFVIVQMSAPQAFAFALMNFGDQNIEQWTGTISANIVQAYTMITIPGPIAIQSVSIYTQYSGSDGTQCFLFGVYADNGSGSPAGQPLVASTKTAYCLHGSVNWGPAWETWRLRPFDIMVLPTAGSYWLAILASQTFGSIYHYAYSSSYDYTYGYADYFFVAPFSTGFPAVFTSTPAWEGNGPYSFYVTGVAA